MRNRMYHVLISDEFYNVDLFRMLEDKKNIKEFLAVVHYSHDVNIRTHVHVFIELFEPLEINTVMLWFKVYKLKVKKVEFCNSNIKKSLLSNSDGCKILGAKHEKKAL